MLNKNSFPLFSYITARKRDRLWGSIPLEEMKYFYFFLLNLGAKRGLQNLVESGKRKCNIIV